MGQVSSPEGSGAVYDAILWSAEGDKLCSDHCAGGTRRGDVLEVVQTAGITNCETQDLGIQV